MTFNIVQEIFHTPSPTPSLTISPTPSLNMFPNIITAITSIKIVTVPYGSNPPIKIPNEAGVPYDIYNLNYSTIAGNLSAGLSFSIYFEDGDDYYIYVTLKNINTATGYEVDNSGNQLSLNIVDILTNVYFDLPGKYGMIPNTKIEIKTGVMWFSKQPMALYGTFTPANLATNFIC